MIVLNKDQPSSMCYVTDIALHYTKILGYSGYKDPLVIDAYFPRRDVTTWMHGPQRQRKSNITNLFFAISSYVRRSKIFSSIKSGSSRKFIVVNDAGLQKTFNEINIFTIKGVYLLLARGKVD